MARYTITATVSVDVEMSVEAESPAAARKLFHDKICMSASLLDTPSGDFDVSEDSISDVTELVARLEAA